MAPSQVSGMKMRTLLFGVILGLLAVVHSTPVNTVTQIPTKAEDEVVREALTEGFLVDHNFLSSLTTESPKRNTTVQASQQLSDSKESDMIEGSATGEKSNESTTSVFLQHGGEHYATTTQSVSHAQSSTSTVLPRDTDDSSSDSSTTQSPLSGFTSSSMPNEAQSSVTPDHISVSQTTDFLSSDSGSGNGETSSSNTETSTASLTSMAALTKHNAARIFAGIGGSGMTTVINSEVPNNVQKPQAVEDVNPASPHNEEHSTDSSTTQSPQSGFTSSSMPNEAQSSVTPDHISVSQTTDFLSSDSGSGNGETSSSNTETSTASLTSMAALTKHNAARIFAGIGGSGMTTVINSEVPNNVQKPQAVEDVNPASPHNEEHSTPGWIIIVGFIVGVAALVILCVAIATRDKWNGPNQVSQLETKTNSTNQQRELEMETFLHKDKPRENGKAAEYTVIPLDELPEKYSSH